MPETSVIIRTKNEERWLGKCLTVLAQQNYRDVEVIIVDTGSTDATIAVAARHGVQKIVTLERYVPGQALNEGIKQATGRYIVCLSAHCLPKNKEWLSNLLRGFSDPQIAGIYGRQVPVAFTPPADKRDLLITFGRDRRRQVKDYFFHNANSAVRREVWEKIPFDETAPNIEDRIWAKAVLAANYHLLYEPDAAVYHYHGIHHSNEPKRAEGTVSIIEQVEGAEEVNSLPAILQPEACQAVVILPIEASTLAPLPRTLLQRVLEDLQAAHYIRDIIIFGQPELASHIPDSSQVHFIARPSVLDAPETTLEDVLREALTSVENTGVYPDVLLYVNYLYPFRPPNLVDELIRDLLYKGLDTVFAASVDYSNYWAHTDGDFTQVGDGLKRRQQKDPLYKALYGLGTASVASVIRQGNLVGTKVGILPLENSRYDLKYDDTSSAELIGALLAEASPASPRSKYLG